MQVVSTLYTTANGWQKPLPNLDSPRTLVLVFGDPDAASYKTAFQELQIKYPTSIIAGCSSIAAILGTQLIETGLVVSIIHFHSARLAIVNTELSSPEDSKRAGEYVAQHLDAPDLKGVLLLTDGMHVLGSDLIRGLAEQIDQNKVSLIGGLASDRFQFKDTWVLKHGIPCLQQVCGIGFYGENIVFSTRSRDGFKAFGPERLITHAEKRTLYEIDHRPALELYKEYLGNHAQVLDHSTLNYPLAIWNNDKQHYAVRVPIATDESKQSLQFVADINTGNKMQLMYGNTDNLVDGAEDAARTLAATLPDASPVLALTLSCTARKLIMGEDANQELDSVLENLPAGSQQIGFYSYGELSPKEDGGGCGHHNATMTLSVLYERN